MKVCVLVSAINVKVLSLSTLLDDRCQVCAELDEEKRRRAQDTEDADNVTCMLEKERERLKTEVRQRAMTST